MTIRIDQLDIRFDVEGDSDEATFARLFARHMRAFQEQQRQQAHVKRIAERARHLGDRSGDDR